MDGVGFFQVSTMVLQWMPGLLNGVDPFELL